MLGTQLWFYNLLFKSEHSCLAFLSFTHLQHGKVVWFMCRVETLHRSVPRIVVYYI